MKVICVKSKAIRLFAVLALLAGPFLISSTAPVIAQATGSVSFSQIIVNGNQRIESATIRNFAGIQRGKPVTPGEINAAYQRLVATGLFEEVAVTPRGGQLVIAVREYPTINRINFESNKKIKDEKLADLITSRPRHTYSPVQAEADAAIIVEAYRQAGRHTAEVKPKIIRRSDNRVDLVFEIFEGKTVEIQRLSFVGNRSFSDRRLRLVLSTKQAGILRGLIRSDTFIADRIEFDKQVLRDFYLSRGYVDFEILSVATEVARQRNGFFVTFKVREGQSYKFGQISTSSALSEIDPDEFQSIVRIKPGTTYGPNAVETVVSRMETLASQKGLNFIRVNPRVTRNDQNLTLDIEFVIERGPRVFVERIDIEGNTTTLDRVVRRQFKTVEGDPFNPREIRQASRRIEALGFFSRSDVSAREGSSPDRVIVDVDVEEQKTGSLSFGLSYSGSGGVGGTLSLSESNFLGRGQFVKVELGGGENSANYDLTFAEPAFLDRKVRLELGAFHRSSTQQASFFDTKSTGFAPKLGFPVSRKGVLEVSYRGESKTILNKDPDSSILIVEGTRQTGAIGLSYTYDSRKSGLNPNAGIIFRLNQEIAGVGGTARYSKTSALLGARTSVMNEEVGLSVELEGGFLTDFSGASSISDRFFMGENVMRGYQASGIGPRDMGAPNEDALGGNMFAVARLEANFPIGLPEEYGIDGGVFLDVGSLWGLDDLDGGEAGGEPVLTAGMQLRAVVGVSLFWKTAIGPLRFNLSRVLAGPAYDKPESFSMTIGSSF